jgi:hypothetical protein
MTAKNDPFSILLNIPILNKPDKAFQYSDLLLFHCPAKDWRKLIGDDINPNFSEVYENIATQPLSIKATRRRTPGRRRRIFRTSLAHDIAEGRKPSKKLPASNFRICLVRTTAFQ